MTHLDRKHSQMARLKNLSIINLVQGLVVQYLCCVRPDEVPTLREPPPLLFFFFFFFLLLWLHVRKCGLVYVLACVSNSPRNPLPDPLSTQLVPDRPCPSLVHVLQTANMRVLPPHTATYRHFIHPCPCSSHIPRLMATFYEPVTPYPRGPSHTRPTHPSHTPPPKKKLPLHAGSSIWEHQHHAELIQTRHYRSPEVIIGSGWSYPADMWSVGCILGMFVSTKPIARPSLPHCTYLVLSPQAMQPLGLQGGQDWVGGGAGSAESDTMLGHARQAPILQWPGS